MSVKLNNNSLGAFGGEIPLTLGAAGSHWLRSLKYWSFMCCLLI